MSGEDSNAGTAPFSQSPTYGTATSRSNYANVKICIPDVSRYYPDDEGLDESPLADALEEQFSRRFSEVSELKYPWLDCIQVAENAKATAYQHMNARREQKNLQLLPGPHTKAEGSRSKKRMKAIQYCDTCRQHKIQCDQKKPFCGNCERNGRQCAGYRPTPRPYRDVLAAQQAALASHVSSPGNTEPHQSLGPLSQKRPPRVFAYHAQDDGNVTVMHQHQAPPSTIRLARGDDVYLVKSIDEQIVYGTLGKVLAFMDDHNFDPYEIDRAIANEESTVASVEIDGFSSRYWPIVRFVLPDSTMKDLLCQPETFTFDSSSGIPAPSRMQIPLRRTGPEHEMVDPIAKDRAKQNVHRQLMALEQQNKIRLLTARQIQDSMVPDRADQPTEIMSSGLQPYQMQIMLNEQNSKKRLLMARQEQDLKARPQLPSVAQYCLPTVFQQQPFVPAVSAAPEVRLDPHTESTAASSLQERSPAAAREEPCHDLQSTGRRYISLLNLRSVISEMGGYEEVGKHDKWHNLAINMDLPGDARMIAEELKRGIPATQSEWTEIQKRAIQALQDYQMQLMLLEQQNKKRLLIARQEQDSMAQASGPSHGDRELQEWQTQSQMMHRLKQQQQHANTLGRQGCQQRFTEQERKREQQSCAAANARQVLQMRQTEIKNRALQDYQMQLMLLEQQKKKRLLMAGQEQDSMAPTAGPSHGDRELHEWEMEAQNKHSLEPQQTDTRMRQDCQQRFEQQEQQEQQTRTAADERSHALRDYQMTFMLLEQQNKKRLLMAGQEHNRMAQTAEPSYRDRESRDDQIESQNKHCVERQQDNIWMRRYCQQTFQEQEQQAHAAADARPSALQDYETQLMLLKQQNRERLLTVGREQDNPAHETMAHRSPAAETDDRDRKRQRSRTLSPGSDRSTALADWHIALDAETPLEKYPAKQHARRVAEKLGADKGVIYLVGTPDKTYQDSDVEVPFRQDRYFYYLSGCDAPDCQLTYNIEADLLTLYLPEIDTSRRVLYNGRGLTVEEAVEKFDIDKARYIGNGKDRPKRGCAEWLLWQGAFDTSPDGPSAVFLLNIFPEHSLYYVDIYVWGLFSRACNADRLKPAMHACRVIKDSHEIGMIRKANQITEQAHTAVLSNISRLQSEANVEGIYTDVCIQSKAKKQAYAPICGSGSNAAILHYIKNDEDFGNRQLMVMDAGCEWDCYASDVTRTFPILKVRPGEWPSREAEDIYKLVQEMQERCIDMMGPGRAYIDAHWAAHEIAIRGLLQLGILQNGSLDEIFHAGTSIAFFPHGLGHHLGLEVHDVSPPPARFHLPPHWYKDEKDASNEDLEAFLLAYSRYQPVASAHLYTDMAPQNFGIEPTLCSAPCTAPSPLLEPGMVVTVEPGIYFNPIGLESYLKDPHHAKYINREVLERYMPVGGVRIEDDILITGRGYENLTTTPKGEKALEIIRRGGLLRGGEEAEKNGMVEWQLPVRMG